MLYRGILLFILTWSLAGVAEGPIGRSWKRAQAGSPGYTLLNSSTEILNDTEFEARSINQSYPFIGRDDIVNDRIFDAAIQMTKQVHVLMGDESIGRMSVMRRAVQLVMNEEIPEAPIFEKVLSNSIWVALSSQSITATAERDSIAARSKAVNNVLTAAAEVSKNGQPVYLILRDVHEFDPSHLELIYSFLKQNKDLPMHVFGTTSPTELALTLRDNPALDKSLDKIPINELTDAQIEQAIQLQFVPRIREHFGLEVDSEAIRLAVKNGLKAHPDTTKIMASIRAIEGAAIYQTRNGGGGKTIQRSSVFRYIQKIVKLPVDPLDFKAMADFKRNLLIQLNKQVPGQSRMNADIVSLVEMMLKPGKRGIVTGIATGPTGVGKSRALRVVAKLLYDDEKALLEIEGTDFSDKSDGANLKKVFGPEAGLVGYGKTTGTLCEFLDGPGKFGGIIVVNEGEKAGSQFWRRMMEFQDTGSTTGGDGKRRSARNHLFMVTSNRGAGLLFPPKAYQWDDEEIQKRTAAISEDQIKELFLTRTSGRDDGVLPREIVNRTDLYTVAAPINESAMREILRNVSEELRAESASDQQVELIVSEDVVKQFVSSDFNPINGVRPTERKLIRTLVQLRDAALAKVPNHLLPGAKVEITLQVTDGKSEIAATVLGETVSTKAPVKSSGDALDDPKMIERLRQLPEKMARDIKGQEEAMAAVSKAVVGHLSTPLEERSVLSVMLIGGTGEGKTQTARSLAENAFGSEDFLEVIPMAEIMTEAEWNNVFNSPAGYVGSEQERLFEQALQNLPNGGVIALDEFSAVGGKNKGLKNALLTKFLNMLDRGVWVSPASGRSYNLNLYIFAMLGNDGSEVFARTSDERLRLKIWNKAKSRESVTEILVRNGVPRPLIGRQAEALLFSPLQKAHAAEIAKSISDGVLKKVRARRGVKVSHGPDFEEKLAEYFFDNGLGARSIVLLMRNRIVGAIYDGLLKVGYTPDTQKSFAVDLKLGSEGVRSLDGKTSNQISLKLEVAVDGRKAHEFQENLTRYGKKQRAMSLKDKIETAYHEAGHAVTNDTRISNEVVSMITVDGRDGVLGFVDYETANENKPNHLDRKTVVHRIARLFGGQVSMMMAGISANSGWQSDLEKAREVASRYVVDLGMADLQNGKIRGGIKQKKSTDMSEASKVELEKQISDLLQKGWEEAGQKVQKNWNLVRATVKRLVNENTISGEEFYSLRQAVVQKLKSGEIRIRKPERRSKKAMLCIQAVNGGGS